MTQDLAKERQDDDDDDDDDGDDDLRGLKAHPRQASTARSKKQEAKHSKQKITKYGH